MIIRAKAKAFDFVRGKGKREIKQTGGNIYVRIRRFFIHM